MRKTKYRNSTIKNSYLKNINNVLPHWVALIFSVLAICLVPWTVYLSYSLPRKSIVSNWDITWVGLDIGLMFLLTLTALFAVINSKWIIISSLFLSSFLFLDAWFDIQTSSGIRATDQSVILAIFVEIPLAIISFMIAFNTIRNMNKS